jgi:epsilon-lactone hydrolase
MAGATAGSLYRKQVNTALKMRDVNESRRYLDSVAISSQALSEVNIRNASCIRSSEEAEFSEARSPARTRSRRSLSCIFMAAGTRSTLRLTRSFIAQITLAAKSRTFALDYRLSPEHRFPAQLDDALHTYQWLLESGTDPETLILAGDSAGGNLALALLLQARD